MKTATAAKRYAKSLLYIAIEKGVLENIKTDMAIVANACLNAKDLRIMLNNPILKSDKKGNILKVIFESRLSELSNKFIALITKKKREALLPQIANEFAVLYNDYRNVITAIVTSAHSLDDILRKKVMEIIGNSVKSEVELFEYVNKKLIGGFIISIGNTQVDASVARSLKNLKKEFLAN